MTISIMQPTYLPWIGYFHAIKKSDVFVFLDDVKLEKSSWHTRNKILVNAETLFLTVPVTGSRHQQLAKTKVCDDSQWRTRHRRTICQNYTKHPFGEDIIDVIIPIIENRNIRILSELNIEVIKAISYRLNISTKFHLSSDIQTSGVRSDRLVEICNHFSQTEYRSPIGSKEYIDSDGALKEAKIQTTYQIFDHARYPQFGANEFVPYLSIIDLIANLGFDNAQEYIEKASQ